MDSTATSIAPGLLALAGAQAAASPASHAAACLNCEAPLHDKFCARCGQPAATHRLTMRHLLHEIPHSIWHLDKGILFTLRELLLRPGPTLWGYLRGQRIRYFAPLSLLLLATGVSSFLALKLRLTAVAQAGHSYSAEMRDMQEHGFESVMHYMGWIYIAVSPLVGLFARRALRRAKLNLAEALVVVLYVTAASNFLAMLVLPLYYWVTTQATYFRVSFLSTLLVIGYQAWAYGQLLLGTGPGPFGRWWRGALPAIAAYLLVVVAGVGLVFTSQWSKLKVAMHQEILHQRALEKGTAH